MLVHLWKLGCVASFEVQNDAPFLPCSASRATEDTQCGILQHKKNISTQSFFEHKNFFNTKFFSTEIFLNRKLLHTKIVVLKIFFNTKSLCSTKSFMLKIFFALDTSSSSCDPESRQNARPNTIWWLGGWVAEWLDGWAARAPPPPHPLPPTDWNMPNDSSNHQEALEINFDV